MQNPKMVVLGLISQGIRYGLDMEKFIESSRMRLWIQVGKSTIYKTLRSLEKDGCVRSKSETAERGPGKTVYSLTAQGRKTLAKFVDESLCSESSVYSDRIAGLVFAMFAGTPQSIASIERSIEGLDSVLSVIEDEAKSQKGRPSAEIVLRFYKKIYAAEQQALKEAVAEIKKTQ